MRPHPHSGHQPPRYRYYRPYYTRWYVHPYYRYCYSTTVVVHFGFTTRAWVDTWVPPSRHGWSWVTGYWEHGYWNPGYWAPVYHAPAQYLYVPGYWHQEVYVEGYYRPEQRDDGDWEWLEGYYLDDGTYVSGHWSPLEQGPEGYSWEPGFWDGETWVEGFWRPEYRPYFTWISGFFDEDGIYNAGYWFPIEEQVGFVWVPGWFDGQAWVEGYWVREDEYVGADFESWAPEEGWHEGWEVGEGWGDGEILNSSSADAFPGSDSSVTAQMPLGIPISIPEETQ